MVKRKVVHLEGEGSHHNPIPVAVVLGNQILPSVIGGRNSAVPIEEDTPEKQVAYAFERMQKIIEASGGTLDGIGKITVHLKEFKHREFVNAEWIKMFPDANNRPARHVVQWDIPSTYIQLDVIAEL
jgi:2-iminobutanoate/2-iminopropanoate deaminase